MWVYMRARAHVCTHAYVVRALATVSGGGQKTVLQFFPSAVYSRDGYQVARLVLSPVGHLTSPTSLSLIRLILSVS